MKKKIEIKLSWNTKVATNQGRIGAMYCFKRCDVNQN
jgi:hypothetical protein